MAAEAVRALEAAGHNVLRCRRPGGDEFPCFGVLDPRGCPFERASIDVALHPDVHARWVEAGGRTSGTWEEVSGSGVHTDELFMAWHFARYIERVAAAACSGCPRAG